jgi:maltodextrin utilization protein YvdJ
MSFYAKLLNLFILFLSFIKALLALFPLTLTKIGDLHEKKTFKKKKE